MAEMAVDVTVNAEWLEWRLLRCDADDQCWGPGAVREGSRDLHQRGVAALLDPHRRQQEENATGASKTQQPALVQWPSILICLQ